MTKREFLKQEVLKGVAYFAKPFGFTLNKSLGELSRKTVDGWEKYQIIFLQKDYGWQLHPTVLVRKNAVEDIFHQISDFEDKYKKGTPTIGSSIEALLSATIENRLTITDETEIDIVVNSLIDSFKEVALQFFNKYEPLSTIHTALNTRPEDTSLTGPIFKGFKGLIIAYLVESESYTDLKNVYKKYYQNFEAGFYLPNYERLIELLNTNIHKASR
ncbi:hypothetical protein ACFSJU_07645 [Paradesertivirga mongoliensis]|uniref:DUF4304 domain-containing protein n=1 Tax=Paradesertivirga mongoliensis TaxID=2100740 RepID=A0ABW4ZL53_9SPHI|nr:hypothetical protein [Pedobacter mongoliensis]